jgi:hypothetical protein
MTLPAFTKVPERFVRQCARALRKVAETFPGIEFRLTTNQNVILANVAESEKTALNALLTEHGIKTEKQASVLHAAAMACPALPTCGLALAESERMLPGLIDRIETLCAEVGLGGDPRKWGPRRPRPVRADRRPGAPVGIHQHGLAHVPGAKGAGRVRIFAVGRRPAPRHSRGRERPGALLGGRVGAHLHAVESLQRRVRCLPGQARLRVLSRDAAAPAANVTT